MSIQEESIIIPTPTNSYFMSCSPPHTIPNLSDPDRPDHKTPPLPQLSFGIPKLYLDDEIYYFVKGEDVLLLPAEHSKQDLAEAQTFTAYKPVDCCVQPVSGTFPQKALVKCSFPHDPL
jgi:hypothetical protein